MAGRRSGTLEGGVPPPPMHPCLGVFGCRVGLIVNIVMHLMTEFLGPRHTSPNGCPSEHRFCIIAQRTPLQLSATSQR